jgi:hypothetical protein
MRRKSRDGKRPTSNLMVTLNNGSESRTVSSGASVICFEGNVVLGLRCEKCGANADYAMRHGRYRNTHAYLLGVSRC